MEIRKKKWFHSDQLVILLFILPALLPILVFWIYPMLETIRISTTDWDYMSPQYNYVGLENYKQLLGDSSFHRALFNTLYFCVATSVLAILLGLFLAYLISGLKKCAGFFRSTFFLPWITPTIAVSIVWVWIFNPETGLMNFLLSLAGLPQLPWIESSQWAMPAVIILSVWRICGYNMIFFLAAMYRVPKQLYEAADMDGASNIHKFVHITLPYISPTTFFVIIVDLIDSMKAYDQILILTQGGPAGSTRTILYYFFQLAFEQFNMGQATATAVFLVLITASLSAVNFYFSKKWVNY
ncbi:MAG: sugar ABC transporter permease [Oscillospiraceae bacterium]|nr:sugar ABC transporter permease [Oscillospiraceae bacterium]